MYFKYSISSAKWVGVWAIGRCEDYLVRVPILPRHLHDPPPLRQDPIGQDLVRMYPPLPLIFPPVYRRTDTSKNITFPGKRSLKIYFADTHAWWLSISVTSAYAEVDGHRVYHPILTATPRIHPKSTKMNSIICEAGRLLVTSMLYIWKRTVTLTSGLCSFC